MPFSNRIVPVTVGPKEMSAIIIRIVNKVYTIRKKKLGAQGLAPNRVNIMCIQALNTTKTHIDGNNNLYTTSLAPQ